MILLLIVDTWGKGVERPPKWVRFTTKLETLIKFQKIRFKQLAKINFLVPIFNGLYLLGLSLTLLHSSRSDYTARKRYIFPSISTKKLERASLFPQKQDMWLFTHRKTKEAWETSITAWSLKGRSTLHLFYLL